MKSVRNKEWLELTIQNDPYSSVRDVLNYFLQSRKKCYLMAEAKEILCNGIPSKADDLLKENDVVSLRVFTASEIDFIPENIPGVSIVYEDEIIVIVSKPSGILVHPDHKEGRGTLCNAVSYYYQTQGIETTVRYIHRLDKETSGLVLFCKVPFFQPLLDKQLSEKKINRLYLAACEGLMPLNQNTRINAPIGRDRHDSQKQRISQTGKAAVTDIECVQNNKEKKYSIIACRLETGRTHQIRVHLAQIGHPILSDTLYGKKSPLLPRLALHAWKLVWTDPLSLKAIEVMDDIPPELDDLIKAC